MILKSNKYHISELPENMYAALENAIAKVIRYLLKSGVQHTGIPEPLDMQKSLDTDVTVIIVLKSECLKNLVENFSKFDGDRIKADSPII